MGKSWIQFLLFAISFQNRVSVVLHWVWVWVWVLGEVWNLSPCRLPGGSEDEVEQEELGLFMRTNPGEEFSLLPLNCPSEAGTKPAGCKGVLLPEMLL